MIIGKGEKYNALVSSIFTWKLSQFGHMLSCNFFLKENELPKNIWQQIS